MKNLTSWNKIYTKIGSKYTNNLKFWPNIVSFLQENKVKNVLDVGCGTGYHLLELAKNNFNVFGLDSSYEAIKLARKRFNQFQLKGNFQVSSMYEKFPYPDNFFEAVISLRTLNHGMISQIKKTAKEIKRVTKKGGILFLTVIKIPGRKNIIGKTTLNTIKVKIVKPRTYIPLEGKEAGIIHYLFNKEILVKLFNNYEILKFWTGYGKQKWERYYCLLGKKLG